MAPRRLERRHQRVDQLPGAAFSSSAFLVLESSSMRMLLAFRSASDES